MDYFKKNKIAVVTIVVLVILNLLSIAFIIWMPMRRNNFMRRDPVNQFLEQELRFSDLQKQQYAQLRSQMFQHGDSMMTVQSATLDEMFSSIRSDTLNREKIRQCAQKLGAIEVDRSIQLAEHFYALRSICNQSQKQKYDSIMVEVSRHIRDERNLPPPPHK
jgi:periplasmic protein CpxP/Spy